MMCDNYKHANECLDKARYYLGQALIATRKEKDAAKKAGESEWRAIMAERCDKIKRLYVRCDGLVSYLPTEDEYGVTEDTGVVE